MKSNEIDSENTPMNECVLPDPQLHFFVACTNHDTLIQKKTSVFTKMSIFTNSCTFI